MAASLQKNTELHARLLRDRVTVTAAPPGGGAVISKQCFIDGMEGVIEGGVWKVTIALSSADAYDNNLSAAPSAWMILGTVTTSELGVGKLGY